MDIFFHIVRYTHFWAVPLLMISAQFSYIYWLKSIRRAALCFAFVAAFCFICIVYYYWAGGPELAVKLIADHF